MINQSTLRIEMPLLSFNQNNPFIFIHTTREHACKMAFSDNDMRRILESVGAENSVISNFEAQGITTEVVPTLSDAQLIQLGLTTLGKRQLIRSLCRNSSSGNGK